jgi:hypothetical protein
VASLSERPLRKPCVKVATKTVVRG